MQLQRKIKAQRSEKPARAEKNSVSPEKDIVEPKQSNES
jgi:hypothetical protein